MKLIVISFMCLAVHSAFGQVSFPKNSENKVEFSNVVEMDSMAKKDVFNNSKLWVVKNFNSANDVIQYEDSVEGKIIGKANFEIQPTGSGAGGTIHESQAGAVFFTFEISAKDDKCRILIYDISHKAKYSGGEISNLKPDSGGMTMTGKTWNSIQEEALHTLNALVIGYKAFMIKAQAAAEERW